MNNKTINIGIFENICMLVALTSTQTYLGMPRMITEAAGSAGWMLILYLLAISLLLFFIIQWLYKGNEGLDIVDISEKLGGMPVKLITLILFEAVVFMGSSLTLRQFAEDMKIISLNISPISYVTLFFVAGALVACLLGIEAISRASALIVPVIFTGFIILIISVIGRGNILNLAPIFGIGPKKLFLESLPRISIFSGYIIILITAPYVRTHENFRKIGLYGLAASGFIMFVSVVTYTLVIPYPVSTQYFLPSFQLARMINYGRFFQRLESVFVFTWASSAILYLSILIYIGLQIFVKTFGLKYYKPIIFSFCTIIFMLSLLPENLPSAVHIEGSIFRNYLFIITFIYVILLFSLTKVFRNSPSQQKKRGAGND